MGDNLERILRENDLRLRRVIRDDVLLQSMIDGWNLLPQAFNLKLSTGVDEFPFRC